MKPSSYGSINTQNQHPTSKASCEENGRKNISFLNLELMNNTSVERKKLNLINKPTRKCNGSTATFLNTDESRNHSNKGSTSGFTNQNPDQPRHLPKKKQPNVITKPANTFHETKPRMGSTPREWCRSKTIVAYQTPLLREEKPKAKSMKTRKKPKWSTTTEQTCSPLATKNRPKREVKVVTPKGDQHTTIIEAKPRRSCLDWREKGRRTVKDFRLR